MARGLAELACHADPAVEARGAGSEQRRELLAAELLAGPPRFCRLAVGGGGSVALREVVLWDPVGECAAVEGARVGVLLKNGRGLVSRVIDDSATLLHISQTLLNSNYTTLFVNFLFFSYLDIFYKLEIRFVLLKKGGKVMKSTNIVLPPLFSLRIISVKPLPMRRVVVR